MLDGSQVRVKARKNRLSLPKSRRAYKCGTLGCRTASFSNRGELSGLRLQHTGETGLGLAALGALDTEIELKLRREGQRSAPATARCFLFTKCGFGRVLRGDCDSLQTSKQKLLPSRPTVTCLCLLRRCFVPRKPPPLAHDPRALSISHWPRIHLVQCAIHQHVHKQHTGCAFHVLVIILSRKHHHSTCT